MILHLIQVWIVELFDFIPLAAAQVSFTEKLSPEDPNSISIDINMTLKIKSAITFLGKP